MKTKFIASVMVMLLTSASLFAANTAATVELLNQRGSSIYKVVCKTAGTGKAILKVYGTTGVLLSETISFTNGFSMPLDFKGLTSGEYTVEVMGKGIKFRQTIALNVNNKKPVAYALVRKQLNKKELLTISTPIPSEFNIRIFDKWGNEVFNQVQPVSDSYGVVLNVSNLGSGYIVQVLEMNDKVKLVTR